MDRRLWRDISGRGQLSILLSLLFVLAVLGTATANRQRVDDWWRLRNYQAPMAVATLASQDTLTNYARKVFYVNSPHVEEKTAFRIHCPNNGGEQTIILGCYHGGQNGIYLLNVIDPQLDGVEQVTAAHETLHALYDRLSISERKRVNAMLRDYYNNHLQDQRIKTTIEAYKRSEPNDVVNEMHSVFGSEIASLPPDLETYYARYFSNRAVVASYGARYQSEFTSRQTQVNQYDAQLQTLKNQIESVQADLKLRQADIAQRRASLESFRSSNTEAYNAGVPPYNALIDAYNARVQTAQTLVAQYNRLVTTRNAIALEATRLANDLNANVSPINQ